MAEPALEPEPGACGRQSAAASGEAEPAEEKSEDDQPEEEDDDQPGEAEDKGGHEADEASSLCGEADEAGFELCDAPEAPPGVLAFGPAGVRGGSYEDRFPEFGNAYEDGAPFVFKVPAYACVEDWPEEPLMCEFADKAVMLTKAAMMGDRKTFALLEAADSPAECRDLGERVQPRAQSDQDLWDQYLHETAFEAIRQKFEASSALQHRLESTGDAVLAAAGHDDLVWGAGLDGGDERVQDPGQWHGQNVLGLALMRVRSQQRGQDSSLEAARAAVGRQTAAKGYEQALRRDSQEAPLARPWARGVLRALRSRATRGRQRLACVATGGGGGDEQRHCELLAGASVDGGGEIGGSAGSEDAWQVVDRKGTVLAEDDCLMPLTTGSVEAKMEMLLSWMLAPAVHGISKLGVPSAADRAGELLAGRDVEAAVCEVVAGSERTVSTVVLNFCLERIPILGCPTVLLRSTWGNLRSILIIAALYGHDLEAPRTLHEALLCLVPPGEDSDAAAMRSRSLKEGPAQASLVAETAEKVARMLIRGALKKATGLEAVVDCFELASLLYSTCSQGIAEDEDGLGFVHVTATPASAARDFFRRRSLASTALLWCSLPLFALGVASPLLLVLLRWASLALGPLRSLGQWVRRQPFETLPPMTLLIAGLVLALRAYLRIAGPGPFANVRRRARRCARRALRGQKADMLRDAWPRVVTTAVFLVHGLLPACMTFSAVSMVNSAIEGPERAFGETPDSWDALHRLACATLGIYSFLSVALRRLQGEDEVAHAGRLPLRIAVALARGCCVLAAWAYASLALDLAATGVSAWMSDAPQAGVTTLGVVGPVSRLFGVLGPAGASSPFQSSRAAGFCLNIVSVTSQQRLFELLGRREVLLRLIGAEHVTASTIVLLLRGVAVACSRGANVSVAEFLTRVAPPPACCVVIVALRTRAMLVGGAFVLAPVVASGKLVGSGTSFCLGILAGSYAAHTLLWVWYTDREDLDSPALRLAMLVPGGASLRAKGLLRGALAGARTRAVQMMAMSIWERFATWFWRSRL